MNRNGVVRVRRTAVVAALLAVAPVVMAGCGSASSPSPAGPTQGTIAGLVLSSPSCPVERADSPCPPRPAADVTVVISSGGETVRTIRTDKTGHFRVTLAPGEVTVEAKGQFGRGESKTVTVTSGQVTEVTLTVDSGIR